MNIYFVYMYRHPITKIPFYVGYGKNSRHLHHLKEAKRDNNTTRKNMHKINTIKKILDEGYEPIIEIIENGLSKNEACELEEFLILEIGRKDLNTGPLTNMTIGGDGNRDWSKESRISASLRMKNKIMAKDPKTGKNLRVDNNDPRWLSREIVGQNYNKSIDNKGKLKNYILCKDLNTGEIFRVKSDDERWTSGKLVGFNKNRPAHENTILAAKNRKGIPNTKEQKEKISKTNKLLKWYKEKETGIIRRFKPGNEPIGYIEIIGPHKKMTFDEYEEHLKLLKEQKHRKRVELKEQRSKNLSEAQIKFRNENPLFGYTEDNISFMIKILKLYETKPVVESKNSAGKSITYNRSFSKTYSKLYGVSLHTILSIVTGKKNRQLIALSKLYPELIGVVDEIVNNSIK